MRFRTKFKFAIAMTFGATLVVGFQNCGKSAAPGTVAAGPGQIIIVERAAMSTQEKNLLKSVLSSYSSCETAGSVSEQNSCMRTTLESSASTVQKLVAEVNVEPQVCYVIGPACAGTPGAIDAVDALKLQSCRAAMVSEGKFTFTSLNNLMGSDPIGYAEMINGKCLYALHKCIVAVRCVPRSETSLSGSIQ